MGRLFGCGIEKIVEEFKSSEVQEFKAKEKTRVNAEFAETQRAQRRGRNGER